MGASTSECLTSFCENNFTGKGKLSNIVSSKKPSLISRTSSRASLKDLSPSKQNSDDIDQDRFEVLKVLGEGSISKVYIVKLKGSNEIYAMKSMNKKQLDNSDANSAIQTEKLVLNVCHSPFIAELKFQFENSKKMFFVMEYVEGGTLADILAKLTRFSEEITRFYAAEILVGLDCLHKNDIVYRDLRTRNVMLDSAGHVRLIDFGQASTGNFDDVTEDMPVNPHYLAPEILQYKKHNMMVDFWSLGCLIFEMLTGKLPFASQSNDREFILQKIQENKLNLNDQNLSKNAKDLISRLLNQDPQSRLGFNGIEEITKHPFFRETKWDKIKKKAIYPLLIPSQLNNDNEEEFDDDFIENNKSHSGSLNLIQEDDENDSDNVEPLSFNHAKLAHHHNRAKNDDNYSLNTTHTSNHEA